MLNADQTESVARMAYARFAEDADETAWDDLAQAQREANLDSARFIPTLLAALGLTVVPATPADFRDLTDEEVEAGARLEHLRWCRFTRRQGRADHPDLLSYDQLPDATRELDRQRVRELPAMLAPLGLALALQDVP